MAYGTRDPYNLLLPYSEKLSWKDLRHVNMPVGSAKKGVSRKDCPVGQRPMDLRVDLVYIIATTLSPGRYFSELRWEIKNAKKQRRNPPFPEWVISWFIMHIHRRERTGKKFMSHLLSANFIFRSYRCTGFLNLARKKKRHFKTASILFGHFSK